MGACARNMQSDPAEIKPAQCCIKLVFSFNLYYDARKHKIKTSGLYLMRIFIVDESPQVGDNGTCVLSGLYFAL